MRAIAAVAAFALAAVAGCGKDDESASGGPDRPGETRLEVVVRPEGREGPALRRVVRDAAGLTTADLAPVPPDRACAQVYGGPATASITGSLRGERLSARFSLADACEIERWRQAAPLLGAPPRD